MLRLLAYSWPRALRVLQTIDRSGGGCPLAALWCRRRALNPGPPDGSGARRYADLGGPVPRMSPALYQLSYGGISLGFHVMVYGFVWWVLCVAFLTHFRALLTCSLST